MGSWNIHLSNFHPLYFSFLFSSPQLLFPSSQSQPLYFLLSIFILILKFLYFEFLI